VVDLDGTTMTLQIAENVKVKFDKAAIVSKQQ
jgi:preprotein translocase subunit YajC